MATNSDNPADGTVAATLPAARDRVVVGLDIGGSKTRGILIEGGEVVAEAVSGGANVQSVDRDTAKASLRDVFRELGNPDVDLVLAGSGGIDTEADAEQLVDLVGPYAVGAKILAVHDCRLTLAAGKTHTGVAVIAGTGSVAWGRNSKGLTARSGGWGYLLGDEGSGYWIAREAVRTTLNRFNLGRPIGELGKRLLEACELDSADELIAHFHSGTGRQYWAARSPVVFEAADAGDEDAKQIVADGAQHLAACAAQVADQLSVGGPIVLGSGVGQHQPRLQNAFREQMDRRGYSDVRVLEQEPVYGVLTLLDELDAGDDLTVGDDA